MSALTKVFVQLLAVLSVALSMFVIATLAQQENWKASATDWKKAAITAQAKERTVTANAALEQQRALDRHRQDLAVIKTLEGKIATQGREVTELQIQNADARRKLDLQLQLASELQNENKLLLAATEREKEFSIKLSRTNSELSKRNIDLTDRVKELTANMAMAKSRVNALKEQIVSMSSGDRTAAATQIPGGPGIVQADTPSVSTPALFSSLASPIRAEITEVRGDIVSISVGSADGVSHGMKFLIYRSGGVGEAPQYLGTLRITKVRANDAAGMIEMSEGVIRIGDKARDEASYALRN